MHSQYHSLLCADTQRPHTAWCLSKRNITCYPRLVSNPFFYTTVNSNYLIKSLNAYMKEYRRTFSNKCTDTNLNISHEHITNVQYMTKAVGCHKYSMYMFSFNDVCDVRHDTSVGQGHVWEVRWSAGGACAKSLVSGKFRNATRRQALNRSDSLSHQTSTYSEEQAVQTHHPILLSKHTKSTVVLRQIYTVLDFLCSAG